MKLKLGLRGKPGLGNGGTERWGNGVAVLEGNELWGFRGQERNLLYNTNRRMVDSEGPGKLLVQGPHYLDAEAEAS